MRGNLLPSSRRPQDSGGLAGTHMLRTTSCCPSAAVHINVDANQTPVASASRSLLFSSVQPSAYSQSNHKLRTLTSSCRVWDIQCACMQDGSLPKSLMHCMVSCHAGR